MKEIEVEAGTVQEAVSIALKKLDAKRDEVEIKVLSEESRGLFGMIGRKEAKVRVILKR
ncbi:MAG: Jag N-terminal domain-containing protein [Candidatus Omnitrophica bacterium]|nr:Jag N-terminal domain-containing protein [Candidatus Omnitrophota bacterium]